jgi:hypothetical protein
MQLNERASEAAAVVGVIDPDAYAQNDYDTGWIDASKFHRFLAIVMVGDLGASATLNAKLQQASNSGGTGAEDITGKAITQLTQAGSDSNKQALIDLRPDEMVGALLSFKNGTATHFRLRLTVTAEASPPESVDAGAVVLGFVPRNAPAHQSDLVSVDEIVD